MIFESSNGDRKSGRRSRTSAPSNGSAGSWFLNRDRRVLHRQGRTKAEAGGVAQRRCVREAGGDLQSVSKEGRHVYVEGRLRTREFEAKNNGGKRQRTEIVASRVQFLGAPLAEKTEAIAVEEPAPPAEETPF
jgi:single-stranded DNA-binding protein